MGNEKYDVANRSYRYKVVNGTSYHEETPDEVVRILESYIERTERRSIRTTATRI